MFRAIEFVYDHDSVEAVFHALDHIYFSGVGTQELYEQIDIDSLMSGWPLAGVLEDAAWEFRHGDDRCRFGGWSVSAEPLRLLVEEDVHARGIRRNTIAAHVPLPTDLTRIVISYGVWPWEMVVGDDAGAAVQRVWRC